MNPRLRKIVFLAPAAIAGLLIFIVVGGWAVRDLWNWLGPALFGWREITFAQALGLLVLCRILFGGLGRHGFRSSRLRDRVGARWNDATPEQRERFRQRVRERCGMDPFPGEHTPQ
jgi:hypothetical protein